MITTKKQAVFKHLLLKNKLSIAVIGGGSWATALTKILCENKKNVGWYMRNEDNISFIEKHHHNPNYLSSARLSVKRLNISSDINKIVEAADIIILAVPSAFLSKELNKIKISIKDKIILK